MEDEEWEDVLLCSYLTSPDKLGPKPISHSRVQEFLQNPNWAEQVETNTTPSVTKVGEMWRRGFVEGRKTARHHGHMFASRSIKKGYDMMIGWANTVVHVSKNLDARVHPIAAEDEEEGRVRFAVEQFGCLFLFREHAVPVVYSLENLQDVFIKQLKHQYSHFTSHGVCAGSNAVYYTESASKSLYKIDKDLNETLVPGTEGTSDFVVLKDERLFWITKRWVAHCGDKSQDFRSESEESSHCDNNAVRALRSGNLLVNFDARRFCIISPELEIIDSVVNKDPDTSAYNIRMINKSAEPDIALLMSFGEEFRGVAVYKNKIHILNGKTFLRHCPDSLSFIMGNWIASVNEDYSIIKINI